MGILELFAAALLLFRRTMLAGALFSFFILLNILAINLAYDISVKLLSCFLLLLSFYLLLGRSERVKQFLLDTSAVIQGPVYPQLPAAAYRIIKTIVILLFLYETTWPYIRSVNYNDDTVARPYLHGAYQVETFIIDNDTIPPLLTDTTRWKRVFFHRHGYIIIEKMNEAMHDYPVSCDSVKQGIQIHTGEQIDTFSYKKDSTTIAMAAGAGQHTYKILLQKLDWRKLPLLKKEFNWTAD